MQGCLKKHHGLAVLWLLTVSCGSSGRRLSEQTQPADDPVASAAQALESPLPVGSIGNAGIPGMDSRQLSSGGSALDLSLAEGMVIPTSLKASSFVAKFRASDASATFECARELSPEWHTCLGGDSYDFGRLIHRQGYSLRVRARTPDGRLSQSVLSINFVADLMLGASPVVPSGAPPTQAPEVNLPKTAIDLPLPIDPSNTSGTISPVSRSLQVGSYYAVNVPPTARVITYASDKTYNGRLLTITTLNNQLFDIFGYSKTCQLPFEKVVTVADGTHYCEATPTPADITANVPVIAPMNFVTLSLGRDQERMQEIMTFGVFDDASETEAEAKMVLTECRPNLAHGTTALPMVPQFYGIANVANITWCQYTDTYGAWWWGAVVTSKLNDATDGPHIKMVYLASASLGIVSQTQFLDRVRLQVGPLLQPIAAAM